VPVPAPVGRIDATPVLLAVPVAGLSAAQALAPPTTVPAAAVPSGKIGAGEYNGGSNGLAQSAPANPSPPAAVPQGNADTAIPAQGVGDFNNSGGREEMNGGEAGNVVPAGVAGGMTSLDLPLPSQDATDVVFADLGREPNSSPTWFTQTLGYAAAFALASTRPTSRDRLQYDRRNALSLPSIPY
jgi:hypothetical protein